MLILCKTRYYLYYSTRWANIKRCFQKLFENVPSRDVTEKDYDDSTMDIEIRTSGSWDTCRKRWDTGTEKHISLRRLIPNEKTITKRN